MSTFESQQDREWCERADELVFADAQDELLEGADALTGPQRAEVELYRQLRGEGERLEAAADEDDPLLAGILARRAEEVASTPQPERAPSRRWGLIAGASLLVAASLALFFLTRPGVDAAIRVQSGELWVSGAELVRPGDVVPLSTWAEARDAACVQRASEQVCFEASSDFRVVSEQLEVRDGALRVDGNWSIVSAGASVSPNGSSSTANYQLEIASSSGTIDLTRGSVVVATARDRVTLDAPAHYSWSPPATVAVAEPTPQPEVAPEPKEVVSPPPAEPVEPQAQPEPRAEPENEPEPRRRSPATKQATPEPENAHGPGDLLRSARRHAAAGELADAEREYAELLERFPESPEAHAGSVSLGNVYLKRGKASAALRSFRRYIARSGPLREEARWGEIRALDALGDNEGRAAAIESLRKEAPRSAYLRRAEKMLNEDQ